MVDLPTTLLDRVRQPEYTGENRCTPCTVVNVAIALAVTLVLSLVLLELAAVFLLSSVLLIALRGYLVPGTPTLTERYLPDRIRAWFDEGPKTITRFPETSADQSATAIAEQQTTPDASTSDGITQAEVTQAAGDEDGPVDLMAFLSAIEVVEPSEVVNDLCLTTAFEAAIQQGLGAFRSDPTDPAPIAELFGTEPDALSFRERDHPAIKVGSRIWTWPSDGALVADLAVDAALTDRTDRWREYNVKQRMVVLEALRTFFENCSLCGGPIHTNRTVDSSCCGSHDVVAVECVDCGERLLELDPSSDVVSFDR